MAAVGFQQSQKSSINYSLSLDPSTDAGDDLNQRIDEYKHQNPEDVEELKKCIQDVLGEAERTAQERLDRKAVSVSCGDIYGSSFLRAAFSGLHNYSTSDFMESNHSSRCFVRPPSQASRSQFFPIKRQFQSFYAPLNPQKHFIYLFLQQSDEAKEKNLNAFMSGLKDKNKKVVTRARSLARSLIDTICNCTNNVSNPIQQAATRLRRQQTAYERSSSTPRQQTRFED